LLDAPRVQLFGCPDLPARTELFGAFDVFREGASRNAECARGGRAPYFNFVFEVEEIEWGVSGRPLAVARRNKNTPVARTFC
jgi:hypothetical protein